MRPPFASRTPATSVRRMNFSAETAAATAAAAVSPLMLYASPFSPDADGGDDRDEAVGLERPQHLRAHFLHVPHQAQVERLAGVPAPRRASSSPGSARRPSRRGRRLPAEPVDAGRDLLVDRPAEDHLDHFHRLRGGHPQPLRPPRGDRRAARASGRSAARRRGRPRDGSRRTGAGRCPRANDAIRASSFIAAPPYFTTTVFPVNSRMYGSASISVSALRMYPSISSPATLPSEDIAAQVGVLHDPRRAAPRRRAG